MAFHAVDTTSQSMRDAIRDWYQLYYLQAPTKGEDPCQQIPHTIVRKLTKTTFSEYSATSKDAFVAAVLDGLRDEYTFPQPIGSVGLVPVRVPIENCVDGSVDAVSVYAAAVGLIHNINRNEAQLNGEFERGESRIIVDDDMLKSEKNGSRTLRDHVFTSVSGNGVDSLGVTIFSPTLRVDAFETREQSYLRSVENIIGLKRGLLSEVEAVERTAKEITSSEGDYSLTITDLQQMWETAVREAIRLCGILGKLYSIPGAHEVAVDQVVISWGNGVLFDEEKTRQRMLGEVQAGLLQPERYLGFSYKLPCDTPAQRARIRKDYMPAAHPTMSLSKESSIPMQPSHG